MYDSFYEFKGEPFRLSPDHNMAFEHKRFAKARAYMAYAFMRAEGFVMVTGRPGTGKTTLVGALMEQLSNEKVVLAKLVCTQLRADDLLKLVAYEFGISPDVTDKGGLLQQLGSRLKAWDREGRRALLIVDEAQDLSVSALEELRLLTNIEVQGRPLLQIFLLGQPELRELILRPELEQVHQRLVAATHLEPLAQEETEAYIRHRLESVDWRGNPAISRAVYPLVFRFSEGIPRRINLICSRLLLHCAVEQRDRIGVADVRIVVEELQNESLAAGNPFSDRDFDVPDEFENSTVQMETLPAMDGQSTSEIPVGMADSGDVSDGLAVTVADPLADEPQNLPECSSENVCYSSTQDDLSSESPTVSDRVVETTDVDEKYRTEEGVLIERRRGSVMLRVVSSVPSKAEEAPAVTVSAAPVDAVSETPESSGYETESSEHETAQLDARSEGRLWTPGVDLPVKQPVADALPKERSPSEGGERKSAVSATRTAVKASRIESVERAPKTGGTIPAEAWIIALLLLICAGLVAWAAMDFKVPFALGGM